MFLYVQVAYLLSNQQAIDREFGNLLNPIYCACNLIKYYIKYVFIKG